MTTLSVLVPHYDDPEGLRLSLDSVARQTWRGDLKVIVCDDGSKPESFEALERVVAGASVPVHVIRNARNRGRPYTRNVLLDAADGRYTAWLDSGEEWYPNKLAEQMAGLYRARYKKFPRPVWCTCNYDWQWYDRQPRLRKQRVQSDQIANLLTGTLAAYLWTLLGPTSTFRDVGYFDLKLTRLQDLDFFLRFTEKGGMLILPPSHEALCVYHKSDIGRDGREIFRCFRYLHERHAPVLLQHSRKFRRNRRFHTCLHAARFTKNNGDTLGTGAFLARAFVTHPLGFGRWLVNKRGQL